MNNPALHQKGAGFPANPKPIQINSIREAIIARRQPEVDALAAACNEFLENGIPMQNTVSIDEFMPYTKLFSKAQLSAMKKDDIAKLSYEYSVRFCSQEPIYVIDPLKEDESGRKWRGDGKKHKVILELPPRLKRLESVNVLGPKAGTIATECLANARSTGTAFDDKTGYYSNALAQLVELAQKKTGLADKQDKAFLEYEKKLFNKEEQKQPQDQQSQDGSVEKGAASNDPTPLEADWE